MSWKCRHDLKVRVLATPGHTFHHLSYVLENSEGVQGVFTGGSLLYGTTGRTDLLGDEHAQPLARAQHASARALARLPDGAQVWPTHGFGSFCTASAASQDASTIGEQKQRNPVLRLEREQYVHETLSGLGPYPTYYAHMGAVNSAGPPPVDLRAPAAAESAELARRLRAREWVVDLRNRKAYFDTHLMGTVSLGLDGPMATWLGWMAEHDAPITLVGESRTQVLDAQRELTRIGIDRIAAAASGSIEALATDPDQLTSLAVATFVDLAAERGVSGRGICRRLMSCSMCGCGTSGTPRTWPVRYTSHYRSCTPVSKTSRPERCGCTRPATAPPPLGRCSPAPVEPSS